MEIELSKVSEFHKLGNMPVLETPTDMPVARKRNRLNLLVEELVELSDGLGMEDYLMQLFQDKIDIYETIYRRQEYEETGSLVKTLDAYADLTYVLLGSVLESGMQNILKPAFNEVHDSNMSKSYLDLPTAEKDLLLYEIDNPNTEFHLKTVGNHHVIFREDGKFMKNRQYKPANLKQFLP